AGRRAAPVRRSSTHAARAPDPARSLGAACLTLPDTPGRTRLTCLSLVRKGGTSPAGHPRPRVRATFVLAASDRKKQTPVATPREPELQEDPAIDSLEDRIAAARAAEDARQAKERPDAASEPARATQVIS